MCSRAEDAEGYEKVILWGIRSATLPSTLQHFGLHESATFHRQQCISVVGTC